MRVLIALSLLLLGLCKADAANWYGVVIDLTGNPVDGNTLVVDGTTKTFKSIVTSASTQIPIGATAAETVDNILAHFNEYRLTKVSPQADQSLATRCYLVANEVDFAMTASMTGAWGTAAVSITSLTQSPLVLPLITEPDNQDRTNSANYIVLALRDFTTTNLPSGAPVMVNYVDVSTAQSITGAKTFSGANVYSNANQMITLGMLSNINARAVHISRSAGSTNNGIYFYDASSNIVAALAPNANGRPSLYIAESVTYPLTDPLAFTPTAEEILTSGIADFRFFNKSASNTISGTNVYTGPVSFVLFSGIGRGLDLSAITNLSATNVDIFGPINVSNTSPTINIVDTDAATNEKGTRITTLGGWLRFQTLNDDGTVGETFFQVSRTGSDALAASFGSGVELTGGIIGSSTRSYSLGQIAASTFLGAGDTEMIPPTGLSAGLILDNASGEPSADPANAIALWSSSGEPKYRYVGSGTNHRLHNAASQVVGAGTDYPFTGSYAQVTFGSGGNTITLPTAGTYLLTAVVTVDNGATANDNYALKFFNATAAADITSSERQNSNLAASQRGQVVLQNIVTVATGSTIHLYGRNVTAARGSIDSEQTTLSYVRLY